MIRSLVLLISVAGALSIPPSPRPHARVTNQGEGKISNGINANPGQFPYVASLNFMVVGIHSCDASILTSNWLLTSGGCCLTKFPFYVYTSSIFLSSGGLSFGVNETHIHPNYNVSNFWHNDICLIRINGNIPFGPDAQQVTLINEGFEVPENSSVVIPGWGHTTGDGTQDDPDRLQVITNYSALSINNCYDRTFIPKFEGHMCAVGESGQGVCSGDFGGPLTYNGAQVGISSFSYVPCGSGKPDYFARVSSYITWIKQTLGLEAQHLQFAKLENLP